MFHLGLVFLESLLIFYNNFLKHLKLFILKKYKIFHESHISLNDKKKQIKTHQTKKYFQKMATPKNREKCKKKVKLSYFLICYHALNSNIIMIIIY